MRKVIRRIQQLCTKASRDFNKCPSTGLYDKGYERGYDNAVLAVIDLLKKIDKENA